MKKKRICLCMGLLLLGLTACGRSDGKGSVSSETGSQSVVQESQETPPADTKPSESSSVDSAPEEGAGTSDVNPEDGWSGEMEGLKTAVMEAVGEDNYWPDMALAPDMLEMSFSLTSDLYEDYLAEMPMISTNVDTLLIVRAKDDKVKAVEELLNTYRDAQVANTMQYPMNVGKVQASRVEVIGSYVIYVQLGGDTDKAIESGDEAVIAQCQEANQLAMDAIRGQLEGGAGN